MTRYMDSGERDFGRMPVAPYSLMNWEYFAVTEGSCGVVLKTGEKLPLKQACLWIFPPGIVHAWHGGDRGCGVVSFQVEDAPVNIIAAVRVRGFLEHALSPAECEQIDGFKRAIDPHFQDRNPINELLFDLAIIDASLMALSNKTADPEQFARLQMEQTVARAIQWFRVRLTSQPSVKEMAAAVEISVTTLRRLFLGVLNKKPFEVMTEIQMEIATRLLETTDLTYDSVAAKAGFASPRAFARFFTARVGCSPRRWRLKVPPSPMMGRVGDPIMGGLRHQPLSRSGSMR